MAAGADRRELRTAFGEAKLTETDRGDGFLIENQELGLTALCSYQQGETEPQVYRLWLEPEESSPHAKLIPWESLEEADQWAVQDRDPAPEAVGPARGGLSGGRNGWGRLVPEPVPL